MTELSPAVQAFLKALASENRQEALMLFASGRQLTVGEVAAELGIGQSTASQQLAMLRDGGMLRSRRSGKTVFYRADPQRASEVIDELQAFLRSCC